MKTAEESIDEMIRYKESLGYSRSTYRILQNNFLPYVVEQGSDGAITNELLDSWCRRRGSENDNGYIRRMSAIRELVNYLSAKGELSYVLDNGQIPRSGRRYTPYIFSDKELSELFEESEKIHPIKDAPLRHKLIPTIYRLIYFCGLRPTEGRLLYRDDFSPQNGTVLIRRNKARRERLIPISDDVCEMCREYTVLRDRVYPNSPYLFPNRNGDAYSAGWLQNTLKRLWKSIRPESGDRIRVYDLRHKFATVSLMRFIEEGMDINNVFPYLSAYMGHTEFQHTLYYIHLLPARLVRSEKINIARFERLIPEIMPYEEE